MIYERSGDAVPVGTNQNVMTSKKTDDRAGLLRRLVAKHGRERVMELLSDDEVKAANHTWELYARPNQLPPPGDEWTKWMVLSGRGWGKSRCGCEYILSGINSGECKRVALVGRNAADVRDVMIEGPSGVMQCSPPWNKPEYEPSKRRVTWTNPNYPSNGAIASAFFGDSPDQLRGWQGDRSWVDELSKFSFAEETFTQLQFGMRVGKSPRTCITTTPRPIKIIKQLVEDPLCVVIRGSSWENIDNLSANYRDTLESWRGTRIGRQEIEGEILEDIDGALLTRDVLESCRMASDAKIPDLEKVICGVDPAMGSGERANDTGIVVAGVFDGVVYILADKTIKASPDGWGREVVKAYHDYGCDSVVMETNQGGDLVKNVVEQLDPSVQVTGVRATRGKHVRFAPVASLYENRRIIHTESFDQLEDELVLFSPHGYEGSESPDRADALTWAVYELVISRRANPRILDLDW